MYCTFYALVDGNLVSDKHGFHCDTKPMDIGTIECKTVVYRKVSIRFMCEYDALLLEHMPKMYVGYPPTDIDGAFEFYIVHIDDDKIFAFVNGICIKTEHGEVLNENNIIV